MRARVGVAQGRGTVITGRIEQGIVKVGEDIELVGMQGVPTKTVVTGVPTHLLANAHLRMSVRSRRIIQTRHEKTECSMQRCKMQS